MNDATGESRYRIWFLRYIYKILGFSTGCAMMSEPTGVTNYVTPRGKSEKEEQQEEETIPLYRCRVV